MQVIRDCFTSLGLKPKIKLNSRKLLNDILGVYAKGKEIEAMRILDKMDKVDKKTIKEMLEEKKIDTKLIEIIEKNNLQTIIQIVGQSLGVKEILDFEKLCKENNLNFVEFDATLARGFEYYTGIVFEIKIDNGPSLGGGGRFDKLVSTYGGQDTPAVGVGLGVSRIFDFLKEKGEKISQNGLFICGTNDKIPKKELFKISQELRKNNIQNEIDLVGKNISKNIEFAESKGYNFVGIIGENELKENKITIKNLKKGNQELVEINPEKIKKIINEKN